ncbi:MAG: alkylhydroperoxidase-related (seleno)protein [Acidimicrobiales bacterium]
MAGFTYKASPLAVTDEIAESHRMAWQMLAQPGTWWTGSERLAIAERARQMFELRATPPWLRNADQVAPSAVAVLSEPTVAVVDKMTLDAGNIDREWAAKAIADLGDGPYVELIGVVATIVMIDVFAEAAGVDKAALPSPVDGQPSSERPDGLGDIGAHVPVLEPFPAANVARALSLVPEANKLFRTVSVPTYSAPGFAALQWDTPLSRPQVELVASRVAALNECFY